MAERSPNAPEPYLVPDAERRHKNPGRRITDQQAHRREGLTGCRILELPRVADPRGNLTFIEANDTVPFPIERIYYLYDVPGGEYRGGHAHKVLQQLFVAASGSFDVVVDDGTHRERFRLNRSYYGLYVPTMIWRELDDFSSGSVCLVLASTHYDRDDYYYDYDEFRRDARERGTG
jgi:hypothetical protein